MSENEPTPESANKDTCSTSAATAFLHRPEIGKHSFDGKYLPPSRWSMQVTFSVGCFQWVQSKTGRPKRSKAKVRVRGLCQSSDAVFAKAREICEQLDAGTYRGPKTVFVGTV